MSADLENLTSGRLLARNVGMNLVGWGLPAVAALVAMPILIHALGDARFAVVALAWTTLGYFSLFDLGMGRAITHAVSSRLGTPQSGEIPAVIWTAVALLAPIGVAGAAIMLAITPWLTGSVLAIPPALQAEATMAFRLLAIAIPFTSVTTALRGALEAAQKFGTVNALRVPYGLLTFLGPLAMLPFSRSVIPAVAVLTAGRAVLLLAHMIACARLVPGFGIVRASRAHLPQLLGFGGWMTVSNVANPFMNTMDRFVLGGAVSLAAVTYYATPHELVTKMWLFTAAVFPVFFPAFAASAGRDPRRAAVLFDRMMRATLVALFVPTLVLVALAPEILRLWLGGEFAVRSAAVLRVLGVGVFVNCLAQGALTLVHARGRPDISGKFHLAELPVYAVLLWLLLPRWGIVGAAWAWTLRASLDAVLLLAACPALLRESAPAVRRVATWLLALLPLLAGVAMVESAAVRATVCGAAIVVWSVVAWSRLLTPDERAIPGRLLRLTPAGE